MYDDVPEHSHAGLVEKGELHFYAEKGDLEATDRELYQLRQSVDSLATTVENTGGLAGTLEMGLEKFGDVLREASERLNELTKATSALGGRLNTLEQDFEELKRHVDEVLRPRTNPSPNDGTILE